MSRSSWVSCSFIGRRPAFDVLVIQWPFFSVEVEVEYDYDAEFNDELSIRVGDVVTNVKQMSGGWWEGQLNGKHGLFPENFVKVCSELINRGGKVPKTSTIMHWHTCS